MATYCKTSNTEKQNINHYYESESTNATQEIIISNDDNEVEVTIIPAPDKEPIIITEAVKDEVVHSTVKIDSPKGPLPASIGEPIKWVSKNLDCWKGWSLTGYSWGGLTEKYNPWRFKVGIVNGEWEASRLKWIADNEKWAEFRRYEMETDNNAVFGISFTVMF